MASGRATKSAGRKDALVSVSGVMRETINAARQCLISMVGVLVCGSRPTTESGRWLESTCASCDWISGLIETAALR